MRKYCFFILSLLVQLSLAAEISIPNSKEEDVDKIITPQFWDLWTPALQKQIDANIEKYRKADAVVNLGEPALDGDVKIEQIKHDFIFGAHIFNFNQLGSVELNEKYKNTFGSLFNSATIPFYWADFETQPARPRFVEEYRDTQEFWNSCPNPSAQPHWRRPPTDSIVKFCNQKGIRAHGHPLLWDGFFPYWILLQEIPAEKLDLYRKILRKDKSQRLNAHLKISQSEAEKMFSAIGLKIDELTQRRIRQIAERYGDKIQSWDVVNESLIDYVNGAMVKGSTVTRGHKCLMQGDYAFAAFNHAQKYLPTSAILNINDYVCNAKYAEQIADLQKRGAKIDIAGVQEHVFNHSKKIITGELSPDPRVLLKRLDDTAASGLKIHVSEVTITGEDGTAKSSARQALLARNQYRLWFSHPHVMGITWWNTVDGCGIRNEPSYSGIFTRDMQPKPAFYALDNLINHEWKTNLSLKPVAGKIYFRGFKGTYKITWHDKYGRKRQMFYHLK